MTHLNKLSVKHWSPDDQPREKMLLKGVAALSNAELLAIIIGSGNRNESSVELSQRILASVDNNINQLGKMSVKNLISDFKGIGQAKAVGIAAALELGKRRNAEKIPEKVTLNKSSMIYDYFKPLLQDLPHEEFWALFFDAKLHITGRKKISQGGLLETTVDTRIIFGEAVSTLASGVALCHNHPSGDKTPSDNDRTLTHKIFQGLKLLNIKLIDHIIIGNGQYFSFADEGEI